VLIPDKASFFEGVGLGLLVGVVSATAIAYVLASRFIELKSKVAFYEGKEAAFHEFHIERHPYTVQEGIFRKKYYLLIKERLMLKDIPLSPFWEHKILVAENLDSEAINAVTNALANVADKLLGISDLRKIVLDVLATRVGRVLKGRKE